MICVAIIEDDKGFRQSLQAIIGTFNDIEIIHVAEEWKTLLAMINEVTPDVVIMDINLKGMSGIEGVWRIKQKLSSVRIFMLTAFFDDDNVFDSLRAGADGYLLKGNMPYNMEEQIQKVYRGEAIIDGLIARKVLDYFSRNEKRIRSQLEKLTSQEVNVLKCIVNGLSYKQIAAELFVSINTVNSHIKNVYGKLQVHSRSELVARYGLYYL